MTQGQRIKQIRQSLELSQDDFGKIFNIPKQMVSSLENDKLKLNNEKLVKLLNDYNVNINFLLAGKGNMFILPEFEKVEDEFINKVRQVVLEMKQEGLFKD